MPLLYQRFQLKPGADRAKFGDLVLEACRATRANEGVRSARYYWANPNSVVVLIDYEHSRNVFGGTPTPEGARRNFAAFDMADQTAWELWGEARAGTEAYERAQQT